MVCASVRTAHGSGRYAAPVNQPPALLRNGVVNRILYYTGSFNPPHAGHLAGLKYAVKHCGEDYNVVAIVVEMTPDESLETKFRQQPGTLLLPSLTRMMYWERALLQDEDLANKCWASPSGAVVWSCKKQVYQDYTIRFVSASEPMSPSPSSTAIQLAIATSGPEELEENLHRSGALVHEILAMAIRNWNW
ncbi:hypothetical protein PG988_009569 [Apiospora saccharicola]